MNMKKIGFSLFLLLTLLFPCVHGRITAYQDIIIISYDDYINVPINITTAYKIQLVDPVTGTITTLYPNKVISIPDGNEVPTGYTKINALENTFSFLLITNLTKNTVHNFRIIFDATLMQNATPSYNQTGLAYMKSHVINPATGAGTGYQIRIRVNYGEGTDSGENVYLNGKCRSDFADIRFFASDKTTQLSYWIQEKVDGQYAIFWVKINEDLSSNPVTIYIYYGDPTLTTTTSNGENTFIFFDDFSGSSLNTTKWTIARWYGTSSYSVTVSDGYVRIYSGAATIAGIVTNIAFPFPIAIGIRWKAYLPSSTAEQWITLTHVSGGSDTDWIRTGYYRNTYYRYQKRASGTITDYQYFSRATPTNWVVADWIVTTSSAVYYENGVQVNTVTTQDRYTSGSLYLQLAVWDNSYMDVDYVFIRKYVNPEPSHGEWKLEVIAANYSISYGQISTESELTIKIPKITFQEISISASLNWFSPESANDVVKVMASYEYGRYALIILPILMMLIASSKHSSGIAGAITSGLCIAINILIGYEFYSTVVLSWIAAICLLLIIYEVKRGG